MAAWTWAEPFAGAAACALRLVGGANLKPPVAWMGGKRRLARAILDAMGVPEEPPARVLLADAGPWGWVWPLLLEPGAAARVALVLRSWAGEHPRELWQRLAASSPAEDVHERAAQWLWLQGRSASGVPVWWDGWRNASGNGAAWRCERHSGAKPDPAYQKGTARGTAGGIVNPRTIATRVEAVASTVGARWTAATRDGTVHQAAPVACMLKPSTVAARLEVLGCSVRGATWSVLHGPADGIAPVSGSWCYLDPPYVGATGYGWDMPRGEVLALARRWADAGAVVAVSEAEPLDLPGWHHLELTREGGKPEWLTLSRAPARVPARQGVLFGEGP